MLFRSGPDEGRCVWRLNAEPGAPPNPEQINRRPDIPDRLASHLQQVRNEIHGPETSGTALRPNTPRLHTRRIIDQRFTTDRPVERGSTATTSGIEAQLEDLLTRV